MTFPISVGLGGIAGWKVLQRTEDRQMERLSNDRIVKQNMSYFRDRIEVTDTAEELVGDFRLLSVALGAFGLEEEINNRALIRKVLESDLSDSQSLANRFTDKRFLRLAEAFDFNNRNKPVEEADDNFELRAGLGELKDEPKADPEADPKDVAPKDIVGPNEKIRKDANNAHDVLRKLAGQYFNEVKSVRDFGWSETDVNTYASSLSNRLWKEALNPDDPSSAGVVKVLKGALGLEDDFDYLSVYDQIQEVSKASEKLFSSMSFGEIGKPENLARLAWAYAYNTQKVPDDNAQKVPADNAQEVPAEQNAPAETTPADPTAGTEPEAEPTQESLDDSFIQRVGLGILTDDERAMPLQVRDKLIKLAETQKDSGELWLDALEDPVLGRVVSDVFGLHKDFGKLQKSEKIAILDETSKRILGATSFSDFAKPEVHERLIATFIFNERNSHIAILDAVESTSDLADRVSDAYLEREFERRVGLSDQNLRLALNARRELGAFAQRDASDRALWYEVLGNPPLRKVFEGAFGFGPDYARVDIDLQVKEFSRASERILGSSSFKEISKPENIEKLLQRFFIRADTETSVTGNRFSAALAIMSQPDYFA